MIFYILGFALGIRVVACLSRIPSVQIGISGLIFLVLLFALIWPALRKRKWQRILLLTLGFAGLGFVYADYHANQWLKDRVQSRLVGKNTFVSGVIMTLPLEEKRYTRFLLRTDQFDGRREHKRLQLNWQQPHPPLRVGERWELTVRLKPPHSLVNFNSSTRLREWWTQNIHATGYVIPQGAYKKISAGDWRFLVARWRQSLQREIVEAVADPTAAATLTALTIGVEEGLSANDWQVLQRTGTVHLVVIAGLHIGLMVMIAYYCGSGIWRCSPRLLARFPAQRAGAVTALIFALGYGALAGFNLPTQRAVLMAVILMLGRILVRGESDSWRRILLAFAFIICLQPGALFSAGFWLSFAAVAWINYSVCGEWRRAAHWKQWLRMQFALFLGLTPLTIYFFQQFSLVSMIANPPAILWIGWIVVPLCLMAALISAFSLPAGKCLFKLAAYLLTPLWHFLQWLAAWPLAGESRAFSSEWILLAAVATAAWCLAPRRVPGRWLGVLGFLPIWLFHPSKPPPGAFWVTMLDVGQGLALTVQTTHHLLVYDTGAHIPDGFDAGRDIISPYLITLGISQIDLLMVSHGDNDHSGGADALLMRWPVKAFLTSIPVMFAAYQAKRCEAGQQWQWDGVPFRVLWPAVGSVYQDNNSSCLLQIGRTKQRILLTGDIEAFAEQSVTGRYGSALESAILTAPHHGSKTSSTPGFLTAVNPKYALFSLGYFNRFHFPAPKVVERYRASGVRQWYTAQDGAVMVKMPADGPPVFLSANPHRYFWQ